MAKKRAFDVLIGKKIVSVDSSAVNQLILEDDDGNRYQIDVELDGLYIPHLTLTKIIPD